MRAEHDTCARLAHEQSSMEPKILKSNFRAIEHNIFYTMTIINKLYITNDNNALALLYLL